MFRMEFHNSAYVKERKMCYLCKMSDNDVRPVLTKGTLFGRFLKLDI